MRGEDPSGEVRIKLHITTKTVHPQVPPTPGPATKLEHAAKYGKLGFEDIESTLKRSHGYAGLDSMPPLSDCQVKNIWMCLNYSTRPTVSHVIDYVRKYYNYFSTTHDDMMDASMDTTCYQQHHQQQLLDDQIKLYLDGYWLPPYESSHLIRENDCIKVDILRPQYEESFGQEYTKQANQIAKDVQCFNAQQQQKFGKNEFEQVKQPQKLTVKEAFVPELKSSNLTKPASQAKEKQVNASYKKFAVGAFVHLLNEEVKPPSSSSSTKPVAPKKEPELKPGAPKPTNSHKFFDDEEDDLVEVSKIQENANGNESDTCSSSDSSDGLSEEQVIDDYYQKIKNSKKTNKRAKKMSVTAEQTLNEQPTEQAANINQNDLDKIASNVNATGKNKWKNSKQKQTNTNGPKHIVFPSTESSESQTSSGTTSSSETDTAHKEQTESGAEKSVQKKKRRSRNRKNKKTAEQPAAEPKDEKEKTESKDNTAAVSGSEKEDKAGKSKSRNRSKRNRNKKRLQKEQASAAAAASQEQQANPEQEPATSRYYEPSKEEQLNAVSYNRTFTIQNPKSLVDFKKIFNQTKLNAPNAEEYFTREQLNNAAQPPCPLPEPLPSVSQTMIDLHDTNDMHLSMNSSQMSTSTSADSLTSSSSNANCDTTNTGVDESQAKKTSKRHRRRSPKAPKYDFESLEPLRGAPRVEDKLAFQILEISSSFTPEISSYKTGTVVEFDQDSNEATIRLNSKYHSILNKPSKFSVVLDHDEDQEAIAQSEESSSSLDTTSSSIHDATIMKIDWRNLMNIKLLPKEPEQSKP